jgi:hypothetical protein
MHYKHHALVGFIASLILINFFGVTDFNALIFWLSSWFIIDLDHPIRYVLKTKNWNPFEFLDYSYREKTKALQLAKRGNETFRYPIFLFHGIESLLIIFIIAQFIPVMIYVFWGFLSHLLFDWFALLIDGLNVFSKMSVIYTFVSNYKKG